eukprot:3802293-Prymnesium_polylepis.1
MRAAGVGDLGGAVDRELGVHAGEALEGGVPGESAAMVVYCSLVIVCLNRQACAVPIGPNPSDAPS